MCFMSGGVVCVVRARMCVSLLTRFVVAEVVAGVPFFRRAVSRRFWVALYKAVSGEVLDAFSGFLAPPASKALNSSRFVNRLLNRAIGWVFFVRGAAKVTLTPMEAIDCNHLRSAFRTTVLTNSTCAVAANTHREKHSLTLLSLHVPAPSLFRLAPPREYGCGSSALWVASPHPQRLCGTAACSLGPPASQTA